MTPRHALYTAHKINSMRSLQEKKREAKKFADDEHFLLKFTHDYFFYRSVKKNEITKQGYWTQVREISYLILLDLLHPEKAIPTESWKKPKHSAPTVDGSSANWLGERQLRRIREEEYPEVFYTPHDCHQNKKDQRETRYLTVFSDMPLENDESWSLAKTLLTSLDIARAEFTDDYMKVRPVMAGLRMVDPEDLIGLEKFWHIQKHCLEILTSKYKQSTHNKWLPLVLKERTNILEHMYQFIDQAVALHWYRNIKSEQKKERLMHERAPWIYTEEDAKKAVALTFKWFENSPTSMDIIARGADTYVYLGMFNIALSLYDECLKQPQIDMSEKGYCYYKIAYTHWENNEFQKSLDSLMKSLAVYEEQGKKITIGIIWGYIAEVNKLLKNDEKYEEAKHQSKTVLSTANTSRESLTHAYLDIADCAQRVKDRDWEKKALKIAIESASKLDDLTLATYISQRIGDLMAGKDTYLAEQELGKLKRPSASKWDASLIHYTALVPKNHMLADN